MEISLRSIGALPIPEDFTFYIDGEERMCQLCQVVSVCPEILPTQKSYEFQFLKDPDNYFSLVLQLIAGYDVEIDESNCYFLNQVGRELKISSLIEKTNPFCSAELTDENVFRIADNLCRHGLKFNHCSDYIASKFGNFFDLYELKTLPVDVIDGILKSEKCIYEFDRATDFYSWVKSIVEENGREYSKLFRYCLFEKLPSSCINEICDIISYDKIPYFLWENISERLKIDIIDDYEEEEEDVQIPQNQFTSFVPTQANNIQSTPPIQFIPETPQFTIPSNIIPQKPIQPTFSVPKTIPSPWQNLSAPQIQPQTPKPAVVVNFNEAKQEEPEDDDGGMLIEYQPQYQLDGVISYIQETYGKDWVEIVILTGGGTKGFRLRELFNYDNVRDGWWDNYDSNIRACTKQNAWVAVEFTDHALELQAYTIASSAMKPRSHQPKSWIMEASEDGDNWEVVDQVNNSVQMNVPYPICSFKLSKPSKPVSFFRFRLLCNHCMKESNQYELSLSGLELFGKLYNLY